MRRWAVGLVGQWVSGPVGRWAGKLAGRWVDGSMGGRSLGRGALGWRTCRTDPGPHPAGTVIDCIAGEGCATTGCATTGCAITGSNVASACITPGSEPLTYAMLATTARPDVGCRFPHVRDNGRGVARQCVFGSTLDWWVRVRSAPVSSRGFVE